jgi:SAM-dependent methyltransferase
MESPYFQFTRSEILPLIPGIPTNALEVGAASGATLKWLKTIFPGIHTTGVELNEDMRSALSQNSDLCFIGRVEDHFDGLGQYDLILLLDVLEHLHDPLKVLGKLTGLLRPHGSVIVSLPNIAHLSVSVPLLFQRQFDYQDAGLLDQTHLRFFTESSAIRLLNDAGLVIRDGLITGLDGPRARIVNAISFGLLRHHVTYQYIMRGELSEAPTKQNRVRWRPAAGSPGA